MYESQKHIKILKKTMEHEDSFGILFFANFCTSSNKLQTMDVGKGHSWAYKGVFVKDSSDSACLIADSWICTSDHIFLLSPFFPSSLKHQMLL